MKEKFIIVILSVMFFGTLVVAGITDYTDEVINSMSSEMYYHIKGLGYESDYSIAREYMSNRQKYENLEKRMLW